MGQLYGLPNDIRYAFSDFERERVNAQGVFQYAPMETVTLTLDYTMARNEITEDRGEQTTWLQRSNSFTDITFDTGDEAVATPTFLRDISGGTGGKDFGFEQQRNKQKNELDSIGFNAKWDVSDRFTLGFDAHNSEAKSLPNDSEVPGASATFFSFAGTNCQFTSEVCPGQWVQEFAFNNSLPISSRTFFPNTAAALANTGGTVNPDFAGNQLGSQILRVFSQEQTAKVQQARLDGSLDFDEVGLKLGSLDFNEGRLQFGVDTRTMEMTRRNTQGQATLGNWGGGDASGVPGMVSLLTPFSLTGLFDDFNAAGAPTQAFRGNATALAQWAFANGASPIDGHRYNQWDAASTSTPTGVLSADPAPDNDDFIEEEVSSVYVQWGMQGELGDMPTHLNVGVRYEQTDVTSTANITLPNAMIWQANNDFQIGRSNQVQEDTTKADYDNVLPALDFDIGLREDLKARFSYSTTIARANYTNLFAGAAPNGATGSILINSTTRASAQAQNPALVPLESDNIDVSLEWYFDRNGFVSAGFWNKNVDNFIGTTVTRDSLYGVTDPTAGPDAQAALAFLQSQACINQVTAAGNAAQLAQHCSANDTALFTALAMLRRPDVVGGLNAYNGNQVTVMEGAVDLTGDASRGDPLYQFDIQSPINQESARIYGWEMGGQYFFGDTGFGVQANYTIVNGDVEFDDTGAPGTNQFALLGLSDTANLVLMYEKFGFTGRLAYNWRDEFLFQTNQNGSNTNPFYVEAYDQFDLNLGYDWSNQLSFAFEVINLTGEDIRWHARSEKMLVRLEDQSPRYALGMRYKF
jgi:TonB-dependent receptor